MPVSGPSWRAGSLFPLTGYTDLRDLGWYRQRSLQERRLVPRKAEGTLHLAW